MTEIVKIGTAEMRLQDCMDYMRGLPDKAFDLAIVDPPYGLGDSVVNSGGRFKRYHNKNGNWDNEIPTIEYFNELIRVSQNQIVWGGNYFPLTTNKCFVVWDKQQPEGVSFAMAEYAWASFDSVAKIFRYRPQCQKDRFHPTQKPIKLYEWLLTNYAKPGQRILDTHLGSMSSVIACLNMGFEIVGCELDADYFKTGVERVRDSQKQERLF